MGKFDHKIIISDIDYTFLSMDKKVPQRNLEALEYFRKNGGRFTFATGRSHITLLQAFPNAPGILNFPGILGNGTYLYDFLCNKAMYPIFIEKELALRVVRFIIDVYPDTGFRVLMPNLTMYGSMNSYTHKELANITYKATTFFQAPNEWTGENWHKIVVRDDPERLINLRALMEKEFDGEELEFVNSEVDFFEIQPKGCHKGRGIDIIRKEFALENEDIKIYACGDYENDISMLSAADVSICPSNALEAVKKLSDHCLCSCSDGLIGELVELMDNGKI